MDITRFNQPLPFEFSINLKEFNRFVDWIKDGKWKKYKSIDRWAKECENGVFRWPCTTLELYKQYKLEQHKKKTRYL